MLFRFRDSAADFVARFRAARHKPAHEEATRLVHDLKGVAGNIGARALRRAALSLECACLESEDETIVQNRLDEVSVLLDEVVEALRRVDWTEPTVTEPVDSDPRLLGQQFNELCRLLLEDDTSAVDLLTPMRMNISDDLSLARFEQLSNLVREYDYGSAAEVLRGLAASLDIELLSKDNQ